MIRAFSTAASAMAAESARQDIIANNIANAQTPGYKRVRAISTSFTQALKDSECNWPEPDYPQAAAQEQRIGIQTAADSSEGPIRKTGNRLDFALDGPGGFVVSSGGVTGATRNGSFCVGPHNELITLDGASVMGKYGPIRLPQDWSVEKDGSILSKGAVVDKIRISGADKSTAVLQGSLEESNVSIIKEMVSMISNERWFEANQKMVTNIDQTLGEMITEGGKV